MSKRLGWFVSFVLLGAVIVMVPWLGGTGAAAPQATLPSMRPLQGSWTRQDSGVSDTLRGVHFVDENTGWAVGGENSNDSIILHTADGGRTWVRQSSPVARQLIAVYFVDAYYGWAVGLEGTIIHTNNGGEQWVRQDSGTSSTLTGVAFVDRQHGWVSVRDGHVRRTRDGGATWERVDGTGGTGLFGISFVDLLNGWTAGSNGLIMRTSDGGDTWDQQTSGITGRLLGISFADALNGWAVGNSILHTFDGGVTWHMQYRPDPQQKTLNEVSAVDANTAWVVGDEGRVFSTHDGGATWVPEALPEVASLNAVHFVDPFDGWAVGLGGRIFHYSAPRPAPTTLTPTSSPTPTPTPTPTSTPTLTPTPSTPWATWDMVGPVLIGPGGMADVGIQYGSMALPVVISGTVTGPVTFLDGSQALSTQLFAASGQYRFVLQADAGAAPQTSFELHIMLNEVELRREGFIARQVYLPLILR